MASMGAITLGRIRALNDFRYATDLAVSGV